jgi:hypothetical protein
LDLSSEDFHSDASHDSDAGHDSADSVTKLSFHEMQTRDISEWNQAIDARFPAGQQDEETNAASTFSELHANLNQALKQEFRNSASRKGKLDDRLLKLEERQV